MKAKDKFTDWLREKVLQNPQEPPAGAWEEISDALDLEDSWEGIGEELEVNAVWDKIGTRLDRLNGIRRLEKFSQGFSVAALLVLLSVVYNPSPDFLTAPKTEFQGLSESPKQDNAHVKSLNSGAGTENRQKELFEKNKKSAGSDEKKVFEKEEFKNSKKSSSFSLGVQEDEKRTGFLPGEDKGGATPKTIKPFVLKAHSVKPDLEIRKDDFAPLFLPVKAEIQEGPINIDPYPAAYAGAGTAIKSGWFLNNKTLYALERQSLVTASPGFYNDFWLLYGTRIKPRLFLQADVYLKETAGQEYREYRNGKFGETEDRLAYQSLGLTISRLNGQKAYGRFPVYSRILAGVYCGRLLSAEEISVEERITTTSDYSKAHFGLLAGYEYDIFLSSRFILTYGLRSRFDLLNIYAGSENKPKVFSKTRAVSLDFSVSFKYVLKK